MDVFVMKYTGGAIRHAPYKQHLGKYIRVYKIYTVHNGGQNWLYNSIVWLWHKSINFQSVKMSNKIELSYLYLCFTYKSYNCTVAYQNKSNFDLLLYGSYFCTIFRTIVRSSVQLYDPYNFAQVCLRIFYIKSSLNKKVILVLQNRKVSESLRKMNVCLTRRRHKNKIRQETFLENDSKIVIN